jgi:prepilin signal peptidase PulO-like enzyme (type II secretory pathway)
MLSAGGVLALVRWVHFRSRGIEGLGLGDVKLFGALGAWLGFSGLPIVLLLASIGCLAVIFVAHGRAALALDVHRRIAFGPYLAMAAVGAYFMRPFGV